MGYLLTIINAIVCLVTAHAYFNTFGSSAMLMIVFVIVMQSFGTQVIYNIFAAKREKR